jgi:hypothetical protein
LSPFRNDLDAADARKEQLARELEDADQHAAELRTKQDEADGKQDDAPKGSGWSRLKYTLLFPIAVFTIFVGFPMCGQFTASCYGYRAVALEALENCPQAKEALGDDIRFGYVGFACTGPDTDDDDYEIEDWRMPISGSRGSGSYEFKLQDNGDGWFLRSGNIDVDGKIISLDRCGDQPSPPTPLEMFHEDLEHLEKRATENCDADDADACLTLAHVHQMDTVVDMDLVKKYMEKACLLGLRVACVEHAALEEVQP